MYKSRVETFNQVHYFHHLIFLFILQDDMKNKLQYFICMPEQKYRGGKWRQNSIVSVVMITPQVAGPASSCPIGDRLFYGVHLTDSTCPGFPADRSFGEKAYVTEWFKDREQIHRHCVTGMI